MPVVNVILLTLLQMSWHFTPVTKCYVTCFYMIFMTTLNNSDVMFLCPSLMSLQRKVYEWLPQPVLKICINQSNKIKTTDKCTCALCKRSFFCKKKKSERSQDSAARLNRALPIKLNCFSEQKIKKEKSLNREIQVTVTQIYFVVKGRVTPTHFPNVWHSSIKYYLRCKAKSLDHEI